MTTKQPIPHEDLLKRIRYNERTGIFYLKSTGMRIGNYDSSNKHRAILIDGKKYQESRLAVFYVTGQWPRGFVKNKSKRKDLYTKMKDLSYKMPDDNNVYEYHNENFLQRFWRWLNG